MARPEALNANAAADLESGAAPGSPVGSAKKAENPVVLAVPTQAVNGEAKKSKKSMGNKMMSKDMAEARSRGDSSSPAAEWLRAKQMYIFWFSLVSLIGTTVLLLWLTIDVDVHCSYCAPKTADSSEKCEVTAESQALTDEQSCLAVQDMFWGTRKDQEWFWYGLLIKNTILLVIQVIMGYGVYLYNWHTGYTRKCVHVGFFLLPTLMDLVLPMPSEDSWLWGLWNVLIIMWMLILIVKPVRKHSQFIQLLYAAVDRPEDKGYTQLYTLMQVPLSIVFIAGFQVLFIEWLDAESWTICPIIAVTFGDGLAEPVAVYWSRNKVCGGTHTYKTRGMCTTRKFTRSLEGSATVFIWTVISIFFIYDDLATAELVFLLIVLPITMSVLEAYAPHSMDNPFLLGWGFGCLILAHYVGELFD